MPDYYLNLNAQSNGDHEVHEAGCKYMPTNKKYLGNFANCYDAVREARKNTSYSKINGCYYCSKDCHTS